MRSEGATATPRRPQKRVDVRESVATRLFEARKSAHLTQPELAYRAGVSRASISAIENGHYLPTQNTLYLLCRELRLPFLEMAQDWEAERDHGKPKGRRK